ncbi:hypothetical protein AQZ52_16745 [Novosphingobium fuchskuhlense]|uniref:DUF304 domain-containing protein n=2 Tax=Novosphingobium fuchskuhlense TaxID=1117702 RepID=A0A124JTS1_9SPHN|nr:hypothetical protein AQZ52_16745 [Novosphingobium fuchskuhlense]
MIGSMTTLMSPPAPELEAILQRELLPGERLLWSGRPDPSRLRAIFAIWFFAVPWTAFALFWEAMALLPWMASSHTPLGIQWSFGIVFPLFGLPFIGIGLAMLWMPFKAQRKAAQTIYGLTDRRLLRVTACGKRESASVMLDQMGPIDVTADADGYGTLRVQTGTRVDSDGDKVTERFEVAAVPEVNRLEGLLLEKQARIA